MNLDKFLSAVSRCFFLVAFLLLVLASTERILNLFGYTVLRGTYSGGRILEFAAVLLIFVIAALLRQVRDALKSK
jgi:lipopolysaccharide export LptBFGC system permease protein LptF